MTASLRTTQGGRIDRTKPLRFTFDGRPRRGPDPRRLGFSIAGLAVRPD